MSQDHFNQLSEEITNRLHALKNYQFVMFTHILKNGPSTKEEICKSLAIANHKNYGANKGWEYYKSCPVFKVLIGKKFVKKVNDLYQLHTRIDLTPNEKLDLIKILQTAKKEWENK